MAKLKREIDLSDIILFGVGIIVGAGIYVLMGKAAGIVGNSLWISFLFAAFVSMFTGLSYAELSTMYPKEAAEYVYVKKASNDSFLAFLIGWLIIITGVVSAAAVSLGFAGYFNNLVLPLIFSGIGIEELSNLTNILIIPVALVLIGILSFINYWGIKESSKTNIVFTIASVSGLILIIALGFLFGNFNKNFFVGPENVFDFNLIFAATGLIFFAYIGFEDIVNLSEETKNPKRTIPRALIGAIVITSFLYVLTAITTLSLADYQELSSSEAPLALAASKTPLGINAYLILSVIALCATVNTVLIILIVGSRMIYGMSKERSLPKFLSKIHPKRHTPWIAIILIMIFSMIFVLLKNISLVASITSLTALLTFAAVNLSLIILRYTKPHFQRPFKTPLNIGRFPLFGFVGLLSCGFIIYHIIKFETNALLIGTAAVIIGAIVYKGRE